MRKINLLFPLLLAAVFVIGCSQKKPNPGSGDEWRAWTPEQRAAFVSGFLSGQAFGKIDVCFAINDSFTPTTKLSPETLTTADYCRLAGKHYSKAHMTSRNTPTYDVSDYTRVIDTFYQHPECRVMPYVILLEHLDDKNYLSGEDLFKLVHTGHPMWGGFTGFDGMEKCYP